jgi:hypothetical protein
VANNPEYIKRLQMTIQRLHKATAKHVGTVEVRETFQGQTVWNGHVELFNLTGHGKAGLCYAWSYQDDSGEHIAAVLNVPPVYTAQDAVRMHIVPEGKKREAK